MKIRQVRENEIGRIKELYEKLGADYEFPNLDEFFPIQAVVDSNDSPIVVVASLPTVELFSFFDPEWETPGMRMEAFKLIHEFVRKDLKSLGIVQAEAWVPPELAKTFGRRLARMGWSKTREGWPCYTRRTDHV
jgi:hypothetical protein